MTKRMQTNIELEIPNKQAATKQQKQRAVPNKHTKNLCAVCVCVKLPANDWGPIFWICKQ